MIKSTLESNYCIDFIIQYGTVASRLKVLYEEPTMKLFYHWPYTTETSPGGVDQSRFVFEYRANILCLQHEKVYFRAYYKHVSDGFKVQIGLFFSLQLVLMIQTCVVKNWGIKVS